MEPAPLAFPLTCGHGHAARYLVALTNDGGWDVQVEFDESIVFTRHCSEGRRVGGLCAQLEWYFWDQRAERFSRP